MWKIDFISEADFKQMVTDTIIRYQKNMRAYDLKEFNQNQIDPIKLLFDKIVYQNSWNEVIQREVWRQRDKSNNNDIGDFHQSLFQFIKGCEVPEKGWDVIFRRDAGKINLPECGEVRSIYVEMKNKHNTMNSSSAGKIYTKMQKQLLEDDDCACFLVEAIAKKSQNITWKLKVDGKERSHNRIRRVSIDVFYALITGQRDAFFQICVALPQVIRDIVGNSSRFNPPRDTVVDELKEKADSVKGKFSQELSDDDATALALYLLGFSDYLGFNS